MLPRAPGGSQVLLHTCVVALLPAFRYNEAKDLAKNLEKQASKVQAEAQEAGDKALKIFANLTSLPPFNTDALEVTGGRLSLRWAPQVTDCRCASRRKPARSRRRRRTWTS